MINILNSICSHIAERFETNPIYIDTMPQDFKRPSFYIELVNSKDTELNLGAQRREMTFQITYFGPKDNFNNVSTLNQYAVWNTLEKIFYRSLKVNDNDYKKIEDIDFIIKDDLLIMTLRLDFGYIIDGFDNNLDPEEIYELMQELVIKYSLK